MSVQSGQFIIEKLKQHSYANAQEKIELLDKLKESQQSLHEEIAWMLICDDKNYRDFSYGIFSKGDQANKSILNILIAEMRGKSDDFIDKMTLVIANLAPKGLAKFIEDQISKGVTNDKLLVLKILRRTGSLEEQLPFYTSALQDRDEKVRYTSVDILCRGIQKEVIFTLLCPLLIDGNEHISKRIIEELARSKNLKVIAVIFDSMSQQTKENQQKLIDVLKELAQKMEVDIEKLVTPALMNAKKEIREAGARFFVSLPDLPNAMLRLLKETRKLSMQVKTTVFKSFSFVKEEITDIVIDILNGNDEKDCIDAMMICMNLEDTRIIKGISSILQKNVDWWVKLLGVEILTHYDVPETIQVLEQYEDDFFLEWAVVTAYGDLKCVEKIPFLQKHLSNTSADIRRTALQGIYNINTAESLAILESLATEDCDWYLHNELLLINEKEKLSFSIPDLKKDDKSGAFKEHLDKMGIRMEDEVDNSNQEPGLKDFGIQGVAATYEEEYLRVDQSSMGLRPNSRLSNVAQNMDLSQQPQTQNMDLSQQPQTQNMDLSQQPQTQNMNFTSQNPHNIMPVQTQNMNLSQQPQTQNMNFTGQNPDNIAPVQTQNIDFSQQPQTQNIDLPQQPQTQNMNFSQQPQQPQQTQNIDLPQQPQTQNMNFSQQPQQTQNMNFSQQPQTQNVNFTQNGNNDFAPLSENSNQQETQNIKPEAQGTQETISMPDVKFSFDNEEASNNEVNKKPQEKAKEEMLSNFRSRFHRSTERHVAPAIEPTKKEMKLPFKAKSKPETKKSHIPDIFMKRKEDKKLPFSLRDGKTGAKINTEKENE